MVFRFPVTAVVALYALGVVVPSRAHAAPDAAEQYKTLFGKAEAEALATASSKDDAALAVKLSEAAKDLSDDSTLLSLIREKTFALGMKDPASMPAAIAAAEALLASDPEAFKSYRPRLLEARRLYYQKAPRADKLSAGRKYLEMLMAEGDARAAAGEIREAEALYRQALPISSAIGSSRKAEVQETLKALKARAAARVRIDAQAARLKKAPKNRDLARDLAIASVVEADDLTGAAEFAIASGDDALQENLTLALKDAEALTEEESARLGDWYKSLADDAPTVAQTGLLQKAAKHYERFLETHEAADAERLRVSLAMEEVEKLLRGRGGAAAVELLSLVKVDRDVRGIWAKKGKEFITTELPCVIAFPISVEGNYRLRVVFLRETGEGHMNISLPVGKARVGLVLFYDRGSISGLQMIDRKFIKDNGTGRPGKLKNGREYVLDVDVSVSNSGIAKVAASLDGQPYVSFKGAASRLAATPNAAVKGNNIVIDSRLASWHYKSVSLRMTSGELRRAEQD